MMSNLFSVFDPSTQIFMLNWLSLVIFLMIVPSWVWVLSGRLSGLWSFCWGVLRREFGMLLGVSSGVGVIYMILGLFSFIVVSNVFGLVPYVFTSTAHFSVTMSLALPLWVGLMLYGWINQTIYMFAHLVPQGTPNMLLAFMVLIESISNVIRPLTLSVRLGANMIAGHLLLTLLGGQAGSLGSGSMLVVSGQLLLLVLEVAVAFIQAYVFVTLMTLYFGELN
uniref:ATP synthase subunit a n=1 Tax=Xystodesmus sp. YD-2016 TaxID=1904352 RepID=A0A1S5RS85_9MYRI|nr:ATP synthase F0 subunit 6 [Xystodesmus sp. YD-2016]